MINKELVSKSRNVIRTINRAMSSRAIIKSERDKISIAGEHIIREREGVILHRNIR